MIEPEAKTNPIQLDSGLRSINAHLCPSPVDSTELCRKSLASLELDVNMVPTGERRPPPPPCGCDPPRRSPSGSRSKSGTTLPFNLISRIDYSCALCSDHSIECPVDGWN